MEPRLRSELGGTLPHVPFVVDLGLEHASILPEEVEARRVLPPRLLRQDGVIDAGVQATLADDTADGVVEPEVHPVAAGHKKLVSKATVTLAVVELRTP
ncbi:hypothetical protein ACN47A_18770 [Myxococcus fulvus]|uniref:hypothetical protein n=1 Tax=Myxococcus fulvus TaxID=33 RepID=UPI003B9A28E3